MYWTFLLVVWLAFFLMIYVFNDAFIEWCKTLVAYRNKTSIEPTKATTKSNIFTDLRYLLVSGFTPSFLKAPAPSEMTI